MKRLFILIVLVGGLAISESAAPQTAAPSNKTAIPPPTVPTPEQGLAALQAKHANQALADFQQILAANPNNAVVTLYAATAALELYDGPLAVQYAEKARQLDPQSWKTHTTLVAAYAAAGMKAKRDQERAVLAHLHATGAPDARKASGFLIEIFPAGGARVDAIQYFEPVGEPHIYYRFLVHQPDAAPREIDVQCNPYDEKSWERAHHAQAAAGQHHFQLTDAAGTTQYRSFSGNPDYDAIRAMVVAELSKR